MASQVLARSIFGITSGSIDPQFTLKIPLGTNQVAEVQQVRFMIQGGLNRSGESVVSDVSAFLTHDEAELVGFGIGIDQLLTSPNVWYLGGFNGSGSVEAGDLITTSPIVTPYPPGFFLGGDQYGQVARSSYEPRVRLEVWYNIVNVSQAMKKYIVGQTVIPIDPRGSQR